MPDSGAMVIKSMYIRAEWMFLTVTVHCAEADPPALEVCSQWDLLLSHLLQQIYGRDGIPAVGPGLDVAAVALGSGSTAYLRVAMR